MNPYWIAVILPSCLQFFFFLRWLHRRTRDDEIRRAFIRDMAINHLPHLYHALREIAGQLGIQLKGASAGPVSRVERSRPEKVMRNSCFVCGFPREIAKGDWKPFHKWSLWVAASAATITGPKIRGFRVCVGTQM